MTFLKIVSLILGVLFLLSAISEPNAKHKIIDAGTAIFLFGLSFAVMMLER